MICLIFLHNFCFTNAVVCIKILLTAEVQRAQRKYQKVRTWEGMNVSGRKPKVKELYFTADTRRQPQTI